MAMLIMGFSPFLKRFGAGGPAEHPLEQVNKAARQTMVKLPKKAANGAAAKPRLPAPAKQPRREGLFFFRPNQGMNTPWMALTARSASFSSMMTLILISLVLIMWMLTLASNRASNMRLATPGLDCMPAPTTLTLA